MTVIIFRPNAMRDLERDPNVAKMLGTVAGQVATDAQRSIRWPQLRFRSRHGVSKQGAFGQARMSGQGALAAEYGTSTQPARAPLRNALRKKRSL